MADIQLTAQQRGAVEDRGGSLLVSAAAGSGKTKVLVERLFRYVTEDHCHIDDFLIITYTKAAAAELRSKIAAELSKRMAETPKDRHLRSQLLRVYQADIKTVDAFCTALLREKDASLLVRHHLAGGAEQITGHLPAVHQLVGLQLFRQLFHLGQRQHEQAVVHPFQHHETLAHGVAELCGEVQPPFGVDGIVIPAKEHAACPLSGLWRGPLPYFYPLYPTDTHLL